jgi:hypothetical protein
MTKCQIVGDWPSAPMIALCEDPTGECPRKYSPVAVIRVSSFWVLWPCAAILREIEK